MSTRVAPSVDHLIGNTSLVGLRRVDPAHAGRVLVKLEYENPGGSVKDRAARAIIRAAERDGRLGPGKTLLDASSGNTGIAYAMLCAERGYRCEICVPGNASAGRQDALRHYGATLVITDPLEGSDGAIREARQRYAARPNRYFYADQYSNPENVLAHYATTGLEIWQQTRGRVTHFVAALGTSGTFVGAGRRLREYNPKIGLVAVQPDSPLHVLEGLKHLPTAMVPAIYDPSAHQRTIHVASEEAIAMVKRQARHGMLLGWSAGAALVAAERVAQRLEHGVVVAILPDSASRYLSDPLWGEEA